MTLSAPGCAAYALDMPAGSQPLYWEVSAQGFDRKPPSEALAQGLEVSREYLDAEGRPVTTVKQGDVVTVSIMDKKTVMSAQKVEVVADTMFADNDYSKADVLFLPGGPGTKGLEAHEGLVAVLKKHFADGKQLAAICAAPSVFGHLGFLEGKQATCFPGFEGELRGAQFVPERVVCDGNIVTSRGMGTAIDLGLCLVGRLVSDKISGMLAHSIQYK